MEQPMAAEHFDVLIIGPGLSDIDAAYHLQNLCPSKSYVILEQRERIGGTWDLFRYPGIRSDSDMLTMGYGFRPWTHPKAISPGDDIRDYITDTARDAGIDRNIRFQHTIKRAKWSSKEAKWTVEAVRKSPAGLNKDTNDEARNEASSNNEASPNGRAETKAETKAETNDEAVTLTCNFLFSCAGYYRYSAGHSPEFPNAARFHGRIVHPQACPENLDYAGKRVVIIGSAATDITVLTAMARTAGHVPMLQRSP